MIGHLQCDFGWNRVKYPIMTSKHDFSHCIETCWVHPERFEYSAWRSSSQTSSPVLGKFSCMLKHVNHAIKRIVCWNTFKLTKS